MSIDQERVPLARGLLLAAMTASGMLPGNLLAVMVTVGRHALGLSTRQAALLGAIDIYAAAAGALAVALLGIPMRWRRAAAVALATLMVLDLASAAVPAFGPLIALRALHGLAGGVLMGIGYAAIGRAASPDRLFGLLLLVQFAVGGAGIAFLPSLVLAQGAWLLFALLAAAAALMLILLPLLPAIAIAPRDPGSRAIRYAMPRGRLLAGLGALFLFEAGHTAGGAFLLEFARSYGHGLLAAQRIAGLAGLAGVLGALGVAIVGTRHGRLKPILWTTAIGTASTVLVLIPDIRAFAAGVTIGSITWAWSIPIVLGFCAAIDPAGRGAAWASFVAKAGLASGPVLGALVVTGERFVSAILLSAALAVSAAALFWRVDRAGARAG